jgi:levanase/fructan beta-fructosidase
MCVAQPHDHQISFYSSLNLINWKHLSNFGPAGATNGVWECPDLFPLVIDGKEVWVLIVSLNPGGLYGSGTQYFIGDFDGTNFVPRYSIDGPRWLDYGKDNYAGVTFNNEPDGKRILIGWLANWDDVKIHPATSWTTQMTIPRELGLAKFKDEIVVTQQPNIKPTYELKTMTPKSGVIGFEGFVRVGYNSDSKKLFVNEYEAPYEPLGETLHIMVIIDRSSVELFTGDGIRAITLAIFPPLGTSRELTPFAG